MNIKQTIKQLLLASLLVPLRLYRVLCPKTEIVVVCAPVPGRNVGDQALYVGAFSGLRQRTDGPIRMVQSSSEPIPPFAAHANVSIDPRFYPLFLYDGPWAKKVHWIASLSRAKCVYLIGADTVDETYSKAASNAKLSMVALSSRLGVPTRIISFSINRVTPDLAQQMNSLPDGVQLFPRDPVSCERLRSAGIKNVSLAADLSFLVRPAESIGDAQCHDFIAAEERELVGINLNNQMFPKGVDAVERVAYFGNALHDFARSENVRLLLLPNTRMQKDRFFSSLQRELESKEAGLSYLVDPLPSCEELKTIVRCCDYVFSASLHISFFALSVAVPVTCFPFYGKHEGVLEEFEIPDSKIPIEDLPQTAGELSTVLGMHYARRTDRRKKIEKHLPRIVNASLKNFEA